MYCHKEIESSHAAVVGKEKIQITCCSDECVDKSEKFILYADRHKPHFISIMVAAIVIFFTGVILLSAAKIIVGSILFSIGFGLLGLDILLFPFATPQTFDSLGIKKTASLARIIGLVILGGSLLMALAMLM
ncbi:MAG: hypothetical protein VB070_09810 [Clostridiaceae bacterium]|nr:hypothetical protein [Clostridiaceae bacterium]